MNVISLNFSLFINKYTSNKHNMSFLNLILSLNKLLIQYCISNYNTVSVTYIDFFFQLFKN